MRELKFQNLFQLTIFLIFAIAVFHILIVGQQIIVPLVVSFFLAFLLMPLCNWLERIRFPRVLAAITCLLVALVVLTGFGYIFGSQIGKFTKDLDGLAARITVIKGDLPEAIQAMLADVNSAGAIAYLQENIGQIFKGLTGFIGSFTFAIVVPIYIVLILVYRDLFREFLYRIFDAIVARSSSLRSNDKPVFGSGKQSSIRELLPKIKKIVQQYILGMFYVICILFVLNSAALLALGIGHALLFAAFAAVLNIIPFVGPLLGSLLPILYALITKDSLFYPFAVLIAFIVIQTAESNLITPNIVGRNVSLNPLVTMLTLFIGATVWGVIGMVLFIPLVAVLKEVLANIPGLEPFAYVLGTGDKVAPKTRRQPVT